MALERIVVRGFGGVAQLSVKNRTHPPNDENYRKPLRPRKAANVRTNIGQESGYS
jgi:hypothetical protein